MFAKQTSRRHRASPWEVLILVDRATNHAIAKLVLQRPRFHFSCGGGLEESGQIRAVQTFTQAFAIGSGIKNADLPSNLWRFVVCSSHSPRMLLALPRPPGNFTFSLPDLGGGIRHWRATRCDQFRSNVGVPIVTCLGQNVKSLPIW